MIGSAGFVWPATCRKLKTHTRLHSLKCRLESTAKHLVGQLMLKLILLNDVLPRKLPANQAALPALHRQCDTKT